VKETDGDKRLSLLWHTINKVLIIDKNYRKMIDDRLKLDRESEGKESIRKRCWFVVLFEKDRNEQIEEWS
jgi:hypothetical protein